MFYYAAESLNPSLSREVTQAELKALCAIALDLVLVAPQPRTSGNRPIAFACQGTLLGMSSHLGALSDMHQIRHQND